MTWLIENINIHTNIWLVECEEELYKINNDATFSFRLCNCSYMIDTVTSHQQKPNNDKKQIYDTILYSIIVQ